MRRLYIILSLILSTIANPLFSQNENSIFDKLSAEFSESISTEMLGKNTSLKSDCNNKLNINIQMIFLYNGKGHHTKLSELLGQRITNYLGKELNDVVIRQVFYKLNSPYDVKMPADRQIKKTQDYDFTLMGEYSIHSGGITFSKFKLSHIKTGRTYIFSDITINTDRRELLEEYDEQLLTDDPLKNFMDFKRDNILLKDIQLTKNQEEESVTEIDGTGSVYKAKYNNDYNIQITVNSPAYIYAFFYDPISSNFLWPIENPNKLLNPKTYTDFFSPPFYFYPTDEDGLYSYIKIVASDEKIDIEKLYTKKFVDNAETTIVSGDDTKKLLQLLTDKKNIQTKTIVLTF